MPTKPLIQTKRLTLRHFTLADAPFVLEVMNTPGYLQYIGDRNVYTITAAEEQLKTKYFPVYEAQGWGAMLVELADTAEPVGFISLVARPYLPQPDLGFAFLPQYMRLGYAYEASQATVAYVRNQLHWPGLFAMTLPYNSTSIKLLEKLGFTPQNTIPDADTGEPLSIYQLTL